MVFLKRRHPLIDRMFNVLLEKGFERAFINEVYQDEYVIVANIHLPEHKELSDLEKILPNLQQEVGATAAKIGTTKGKHVQILFGMRILTKVDFSTDMLRDGTLKVEFPSAYGTHVIDFEDGASCHMLNGGVTRMGKTCLLLYIATVLFLQTKGNIKLYISSAKLKDYYPFEGIPQVKMAKDIDGTRNMIQEILDEYKRRNDLLYSPELRKASDAKGVRKLYPEYYDHFKPIFLIIDEYARFAEDKTIQQDITEIVETAGFVNVHVIIASQRPDASTVLKPRLKANLLVRMAFTTADRKNSEIILDQAGAEKLGRIPGRALLVDSGTHVVQVPYLDVVECDKLLEPYRKERVEEHEQIETRSIDPSVADKIQSLLAQSDSLFDLSREFKPDQCGESGIETSVIKWSDFPNTEGKG